MNKVETHSVRDYVLTYRYLRITMIAVLLMLGTSVIWQGVQAGCWLGSVSAYYYTPVRNVFVGALFVFGAALIAYHGKTPEEEALLNLSGCMALVVALVPTVPDGCDPLHGDAEVTNNIGSLAIAAIVALGLVKTINRDRKVPDPPDHSAKVSETKVKADELHASQGGGGNGNAGGWRAQITGWWSRFRKDWPDHWQKVLVGLCVIVPIVMLGVFLGRRELFISVGHTFAAVTMVVGLILYMIFNAVMADHDPETIGFLKINYKLIYQALAVGLVLVMIGVAIAAFTVGFSLWIFALEFIILGIFAVYWFVQSFELRSRIARDDPHGDADVSDHPGLVIPPTPPAASSNGQSTAGSPTAPRVDKSDDLPAGAN